MSIDPQPRQLSLTDLARICAHETEIYYQHRSHDPRYCFELFRRAIGERDQSAWELVCIQYQPMVSGWVRQHPAFESSGEQVEYFVNGAFARIAGNLTPDKFRSFSDLGYLLRYLKMCVHSVIVDYIRSAERAPQHASIEDLAVEPKTPGPAIEDQVADSLDSQALWQWISDRLRDEKERLVVQGIFVLALKPGELYDYYPAAFTSVEEIYQIKQNVLARLRRDPDAKSFLGTHD
ncbi:MAG: RNA polymerase sigma factor [Bacteroidota bacterium]